MEEPAGLVRETEMDNPSKPCDVVPDVGLDRESGRYQTAGEALKSINDQFDHWTGRLGESSFHLSLAVIAANWAVLGSLSALAKNKYSLLSIAVVMISLGTDLLGTHFMGELLRRRYEY